MIKTTDSQRAKTIRFIIIIIVSALACVMLISNLNKPHMSPFTTKVDFDHILAVSFSNDGGVIVDRQYSRMLFVNSDRKIMKIVDLTKSGSPADGVTSVAVDEDKVYATAYKTFEHGSYYKSESILTYSLEGDYLDKNVVYTYKKDEFVTGRQLKTTTISKDTNYLISTKDNAATLSCLHKSGKGKSTSTSWKLPENIFSAYYCPADNALIIFGKSQACYWVDAGTSKIESISIAKAVDRVCHGNRNSRFLKDKNLFNIDGSNMYLSYVCESDSDEAILSSINSSGDSAEILSMADNKVMSLSCAKFSFVYMIYIWVFWLSIVWLFLCLIAFAVRLIRKGISDRSKLLIVMVGAIMFTSLFYSYYQAYRINEEYRDTIKSEAAQMGITLSLLSGDTLGQIRQTDIQDLRTDKDVQKKLEKVQKNIGKIFSTFGTDSSYYCDIYLTGSDGIIYTLVDSKGSMPIGVSVISDDDLNRKLSDYRNKDVYEYTTAESTDMFAIRDITDSDGNVVGRILVGFVVGSMMSDIIDYVIDMLMSLIAIFIMLYISYYAFSTFRSDLKRYRLRDSSDKAGKSVDMIGLLRFVSCIITGMDSIIVAYVAQSICPDASDSTQAVIVAVTLSAFAAGAWIGALSTNFLSRKFGRRTLFIGLSFVGTAGLLLLLYAVIRGTILLFFLGKILSGFTFAGVLKELADTLPYNTSNKDDRAAAFRSSNLATISAGILSILMGGYISQYLSYAAIYLVAAVVSVILIVLGFMAFSNVKNADGSGAGVGSDTKDTEVFSGGSQSDSDTGKSKSRGSWKIFVSMPMMMFVLLYAVPKMILKGYGNYILPLYASGVGISSLTLSHISVFAMTLGLLTDSVMKSISRKYNRVAVMTTALAGLSSTLVFFLISPNIYWAVITLFIGVMLTQMIVVPDKMHVASLAEEQGYNPREVQPNYSSVESAINTVRAPITSAFLAIGTNLGCALLGVVTGGMVLAYRLYYKLSGQGK